MDTNLCIRVLRDRTASLREKFNLEAEFLVISTIVLAESCTAPQICATRREPPRRRELSPPGSKSSLLMLRRPIMRLTSVRLWSVRVERLAGTTFNRRPRAQPSADRRHRQSWRVRPRAGAAVRGLGIGCRGRVECLPHAALRRATSAWNRGISVARACMKLCLARIQGRLSRLDRRRGRSEASRASSSRRSRDSRPRREQVEQELPVLQFGVEIGEAGEILAQGPSLHFVGRLRRRAAAS